MRGSSGIRRGGRLSATLAGLALATLLLAGPGCQVSVNALFKSPDQLLGDSLKNLGQAGVVQLNGSFKAADGHVYDLDVGQKRNGDLSGTVRVDGHRLDVVEVGSTSYLRAGSDFWAAFGTAQDSRVYSDHWLKSSDNAVAQTITRTARLSDLRDRLSGRRSGLQKDTGAAPIHGRQVIRLHDQTGDIFVTSNDPVTLVRVAFNPGASAGGVSDLRLDFKYPAKLSVTTPSEPYDPADPSTLPALYHADANPSVQPSPCSPTSCTATLTVQNTRGQPVGQQSVSFTAKGDNGTAIGSCNVAIPPIAYQKTENLSCNVAALPGWGGFVSAGGGGFTVTAKISNPPYDSSSPAGTASA